MAPSWGFSFNWSVGSNVDDRLDTLADPELIDKELDKDILQSIYTLKSGFYLEHLKDEENFDEIENFIELFENTSKTQDDVESLSTFINNFRKPIEERHLLE